LSLPHSPNGKRHPGFFWSGKQKVAAASIKEANKEVNAHLSGQHLAILNEDINNAVRAINILAAN